MYKRELQDLWEEIEKLRERLYVIANQKGMDSPGAIRASQVLDDKTNEYTSLRIKKQAYR